MTVVKPLEGSRVWSQSRTIQDLKRDRERHPRVKLTDPHYSQPLKNHDDWRARRSRGRLGQPVWSMEEQKGAEGGLEEKGAETKQ